MKLAFLTATALVIGLSATAPTALCAGRVWTVAGLTVGADFTEAQAAIDAASDGDIIVVIDGHFGFLTIDGKSLTLIRDPAGFTEPAFFGLTIRNIGAQQKVMIRDLWFGSNNVHLNPVDVVNCAGPVLLEECEMELRVTNSASVVVSRGVLRGSTTSGFTNPWVTIHPALRVENSGCSIYDVAMFGGSGGSAGVPLFGGPPVSSEAGIPAIEFVSGSLFLARCTLEGGRGGNGAFENGTCLPSSDGAPAIVVGGTLRSMETTFTAGIAGIDAGGCPQFGVTPPAVVVTTGSMSTIVDTTRRLWVSALAKLPDTVTTWVRGQPGEAAVLFVSAVPSGAFVPGLKGAFVCAAPMLVLPLGPIGATGEILFQTPVASSDLPASLDGVELYEQFAVAGASGTGLLSSPSFLVLTH